LSGIADPSVATVSSFVEPSLSLAEKTEKDERIEAHRIIPFRVPSLFAAKHRYIVVSPIAPTPIHHEAAANPSSERPWRRRLKRASLACALLGLVALALFLLHEPLLAGAANLWIVDEPVTNADAIVVLGGGLPMRPLEAIELYEEGRSRKLLVVKVELNPAQEAGIVEPEHVVVTQFLEKGGVPAEAIVPIGTACSSTWEDIVAARQWAEQAGASKLLIPTDLFHTRRVSWICNRVFKDSTVRPFVSAITPIKYDATNWWRDENGLITFQNEVIKFGFYLLKYRNAEYPYPLERSEERGQGSEDRGWRSAVMRQRQRAE
jgi:uncharacterized SAM-binding protein YcdF (DUF218 family)